MNVFSLSVSFGAAMIAVVAAAAVVICVAVGAVLLHGKLAANKKPRKKEVAPVKKIKEVKPVQETRPAPQKLSEERPAEEIPAAAEAVKAVDPAAENMTPPPVEVKQVEEIPAEEEPPVKAQEEKFAAVEKPAEKPVKKSAAKKPEKKVEVLRGEEGETFVRLRYNRSFTARLIQADDALKNYYSAVKNELEKYPLKERVSWRHETYRSGRKLIARLSVRGKTLCLFLAVDPSKYAGTKYKVEDVSSKKSNADVPALYRIKNERRMKYSAQIISDTMEAHALAPEEVPSQNYAAQYPYEELEPLIERGLVKLLPIKVKSADSEVSVLPLSEMLPKEVLDEVSVTEAEEILPGENVESLVEVSVKFADRTKRGIVNIDALGKYFKKGETVTLEEIKKRVPGINKKTTYIKVLARGTLDKTLFVEADDFSPAAVKMIVLTGGKATRTKSAK